MTAAPAKRYLFAWTKSWALLTVAAILVVVYAFREVADSRGAIFTVVDDILIGIAVLLALRATNCSRRTYLVHSAIVGVTVALSLVAAVLESNAVAAVAAGLAAYLVAVTAFVIFRFILSTERVSWDTLGGALAIYMALGVMFGIVYTAIGSLDPDAFQPVLEPEGPGDVPMYYFSFVTMTGLGYGDTAPSADLTRVLATLQAVIGLVLLATLVARIVGLMVSQHSNDDTNERLDSIAASVAKLEQSSDSPLEPPS
jgi:hypothetical protein